MPYILLLCERHRNSSFSFERWTQKTTSYTELNVLGTFHRNGPYSQTSLILTNLFHRNIGKINVVGKVLKRRISGDSSIESISETVPVRKFLI